MVGEDDALGLPVTEALLMGGREGDDDTEGTDEVNGLDVGAKVGIRLGNSEGRAD